MGTMIGQRPRAVRRGGFGRLALVKTGHALAVVLVAYTVTFLLLFVLPGDAILARIGTGDGFGTADLSSLDLDSLRDEVGLRDSLFVQYLRGLGGIVTGSLGISLVSEQPVLGLILEALPNTAILAVSSLVLSVVVAFVMALLAVYPRTRWVRSLFSLLPSAYVSLPVFWVGVLFIYFFSSSLGWLPATGSRGFESLILPTVVLSLGGAAQFAQVLIGSLRTELRASYATVTVPAKGASPLYVLVHHCLRNASFPFLTVFGLRVGALLGGTVIIEMVFSRTGIGRLLVDSVKSVDLTVVLGVVVVISVIYVIVNALVDVGYVLLDPRLRRTAGDTTTEASAP